MDIFRYIARIRAPRRSMSMAINRDCLILIFPIEYNNSFRRATMFHFSLSSFRASYPIVNRPTSGQFNANETHTQPNHVMPLLLIIFSFRSHRKNRNFSQNVIRSANKFMLVSARCTQHGCIYRERRPLPVCCVSPIAMPTAENAKNTQRPTKAK